MKAIGSYQNGNYYVTIFNDGTKIRIGDCDEFVPSFSENCDCKLTEVCSQGCMFCYEGCTPNGMHAEIDFNSNFFKSLHPYTELSINGNDMDHPHMLEFLSFLKEKNVIANITVNQNQLRKNFNYIRGLQYNGLIHGIGVSLVQPSTLMDDISKLNNCVVHTIVGILSEKDVLELKDKGIKILLLGYKNLQRGIDYKNNNSENIEINRKYIYDNLYEIPKWFESVSFDNLAIEQLNAKRIVDDDKWEEIYMGNDGQYTFYIDLVKKEYAVNSVAKNRFPIEEKSVDEMFNHIRSLTKENF